MIKELPYISYRFCREVLIDDPHNFGVVSSLHRIFVNSVKLKS